MNIFKRIFGKKESKEDVERRINSYFKIVNYPITGVYFPKYKGDWLNKSSRSGIIRIETYFFIADSCSTEEEAKEYIELYKEQWFKKNVKVIDYK